MKVLYIGGCITGDVQTLDTHRHWPLSHKYRQAEINDAVRQLERRPYRLPSVARATVFRRASDAWRDVDFRDPEKPWVDTGCLQDLSRDGDASISSSLLPLWLEARMPERRDQILAEVDALWNSGALRCWDDFWRDDFLLPYDEHPGEREGMEDAETEVVAEAAPEEKGEQTDTDEGTIECGADKVADEFAPLLADEAEPLEELPTVPEGAAAIVAEAREEKCGGRGQAGA